MRNFKYLPIDWILLPFVALAAPVLWLVRRIGLHRMRACRRTLVGVGVLPLRRHYYDPYIDESLLRRPLDLPRNLPGVDLRVNEQLALLRKMTFASEVRELGSSARGGQQFRFGNGSFESGDAEFLYQFVRLVKPQRVVEIGSGFSTLVVRDALAANKQEDPSYLPEHVCIEPFEMPWLEAEGIRTIRSVVEDVPVGIFEELRAGDLLFIDSSHVIRPQSDVLTEYLSILPILRPGVYVHIHDIFTPRDYPREWIVERIWLWNEQYMVETMLSHGNSWRVVAALNFLKHSHYDVLKSVCPHLTPDREPGSLYLIKTESA